MIAVRSFGADDRDWAAAVLAGHFGEPVVARRGELVDPLALSGFVADLDGAPAGLLTYQARDGEVEVVALAASTPRHGVGGALMDAVAPLVPAGGRLWLITTNTNTNALRFYQRWGMDLAALHRDAVTRARALKPAIPLEADGIALRHEIELEWRPAG